MIKYFFILLFSFSISLDAVDINIKIKDTNNHIQQFAAKELKKYLTLVFPEITINGDQTDLENIHTFFIGYSKNELDDEVNYAIENNNIYLFGHDKINKQHSMPIYTITDFRNQVGTLFSVYDFLYQEFGFRWISPYDEDITFSTISNLKLKNKIYSWNSKYTFRRLRNDIWDWNKIDKIQSKIFQVIPTTLLLDQNYVERMMYSDLLWKRKLKQESSNKPNYGHAFTKYWEKYGKEYPEWFALAKNGKRGKIGFDKIPESRQKFCVTNQDLQYEIVKNWKENIPKENIFNASINDSRGYCTCDKCRSLDVLENSKTDRYVYFWNSLYDKISKNIPNSKLIAYAYSDYRYPPQKTQINQNIVLGFVPKFKDTNNQILSNINGWKSKGLKTIFYRPNDFNDDIGLPMGHEKYMWERLNILKQIDILGLDYDRNYNLYNLAYDGITKYILMQSFNFPDRLFEELENEYYATFGKAQNEIKQFYQYWRTNFEQKRLNILDQYGGFSGRKNIYKEIEKFYSLDDFLITEKILENALIQAEENSQLRNRINKLKIANTHSKLLFEALQSKFDFEAHNKLIEYRIQNKDLLQLNWARLLEAEYKYSNINYFENKLNNLIDRF